MDVSIAVSLMRGQMGTVIERAVNVAVETVLAEMLKVVGVKFEELKREMSTVRREMIAVRREKAAKEKENEEVRGLLQLAELRMKYLKQSLNTMGPREDRQAPPNGPSSQRIARPSEPSRTPGLPACSSSSSEQGRTSAEGARFTNGVYPPKIRVSHPDESLMATPTSSFDPLADLAPLQVDDELALISEANCSSEELEHKDEMPRLHPDEMPRLHPDEMPRPADDTGPLIRDDECESDWTDQQPAETAVLAPAPDHAPAPGPAPRTQTDPAQSFRLAGGRVKEEEVEVICIKEEPEEVAALLLDCERLAQGGMDDPWHRPPPPAQHGGFSHHSAAFGSASSATYSLSQPVMSVSAPGQRPARAWPKDLSLYEEYKLRRAELRRHSLNRRREMEKALPQPLLADMVRERREKTRLRVARWRAKRKLQACLGAQPGPAPPAGPAHQNKAPPTALPMQQMGHALPPYGSLMFNPCDSASAYPAFNPAPSSSSSSLLLLGHGPAESGSHAAVTSTSSSSSSSQPQPGLSLADADLFQ